MVYYSTGSLKNGEYARIEARLNLNGQQCYCGRPGEILAFLKLEIWVKNIYGDL